MPTQDRIPSHGAAGDSLPYQVVNELFGIGLDVHRALRCIDYDLDPDRNLQSALTRLDATVATVLHGALTHPGTAATAPEQLLSRTFTTLAEGLARGFDLTEHLLVLAEQGTALPGVGAAAFIVGDAGGTPYLTVTVPDRPAVRALCRLRPSPTWDTYTSGRPQTVADLTTDSRWPLFAARASTAGHQAAHTIPVRRREKTLGALILFRATPGALPALDDHIGQTLADLAALSILVHTGQNRDPVADTAAM